MSRQEKLAALASTGITKAELDNIDGGTARGTTAIADGDDIYQQNSELRSVVTI